MKRKHLKILLLFILCMASLSSWALRDGGESPDYLCFTAEEDGSTVGFMSPRKEGVSLQTSTDGTIWSDYVFGTEIMLTHAGDKVYFRNAAEGMTAFSKDNAICQFSMTGKIAASGNVMSLVDKTCTATAIPNDYCFMELFSGCTALTTAPELPATTLASNCYWYMFHGCTSLTIAPELPATTLADWCYAGMFFGCTSLTTVPELPATTLAEKCYAKMFFGCTSLNYIKVAFTEWGEENYCTSVWLDGVSSTGFFECHDGLPLTRDESHIPEGWKVGSFLPNYLCFTAEEAGSTVSLIKEGSPWGGGTLYYSTDHTVSWKKFTPGSATFNVEPTVVTLPKVGDKVYIRCSDSFSVPFFSKDVSNYFHFSLTDKVAASGSVMSLVNTSNLAMDIPSVTSYYFYRLFEGCTALTSAPELPATTLAKGCYDSMFSGCTNLNTAPDLPATTLAEGCYSGMFSGCTNLTTSLEISSVGWASLYENLPLKVPEGVEVYYASAISGSTITFTQIPKGTVIARGTAVIVKGTGTVLFPVSGEEGTSFPTNYLTGTTVSKAYDKDTDPVVYTLSGVNSEGKLQFSKYTGTTLGAHKAYLPASALPNGSEAKDFTFVFDDGTSTGIPTVPALSPAHGKRYNLNGVPVDEHYKGLIIKNGKKMWSK